MKNDKPTILVPNAYGAPFEGGFYGGQVRIGNGIFAIAWAPKAIGELTGVWLPGYKPVQNSVSCYDSMANTVVMAEAGSTIAKHALGLEINGHANWCIPARDVLELGYRNLKPTTEENCISIRDGDNASSIPAGYPYSDDLPAQTTAEDFREGGDEAFEAVWYWSSTQYSESSAWTQSFYSGYQRNRNKKFEARFRLVRLIQVSNSTL